MTFCIVVDLIPHLQIPPKIVHLFKKIFFTRVCVGKHIIIK